MGAAIFHIYTVGRIIESFGIVPGEKFADNYW